MACRILIMMILLVSAGNCVRVGILRGPTERATFDRLSPPPLSHWSNRSINAVMLGHRSLYDDFLAIWLVQLLADRDLKTYASAEQTYKIISTITRLHIKNESIYIFGCFVLALDYGRPEFCEAISLDGLKAFPQSWRIPMIQGFISAFKLGDYGRAAGYYSVASTRPSSPEWVQNLARKFGERGQAAGQDLNETIELLKEVPGGTRLVELIRPRMREAIPAPFVPSVPEESPAAVSPSPANTGE